MKQVLYVTGNAIKFQQAQEACKTFGIEVNQTSFEAPEIQGEDGKIIACDKAQKAFDHFKQPLVVCDDNWIVPGLKGFPGAYMKSINVWLTPDDWLHLTDKLKDRRIILRQIAVYQNATEQRIFTCDIEGLLLHEARGQSPYPHSAVTSFDNGKTSNAEHHERGESASNHRQTVWHEFSEWWRKNA